MAPAVYLFGGTQRPNSVNTTNFDVIVIERDELLRGNIVLSALGMSSAGSRQPVISRYALLRLGTKNSIGHKIDDSFLVPSELGTDEIEASIEEIIDKFKKIGLTFGSEETSGRIISTNIRQKINNIPSAEISSMISNKSEYVQQKKRELHPDLINCRGAIETHGYAPRV